MRQSGTKGGHNVFEALSRGVSVIICGPHMDKEKMCPNMRVVDSPDVFADFLFAEISSPTKLKYLTDFDAEGKQILDKIWHAITKTLSIRNVKITYNI
mmetsp:Transcript_10788/g.12373  ORF Transcript_10788/g.12373 Transcript_10788/m.12373 type:complete len:98 (-) Transcript_10788:4-297(-)